jgi:hypothetical protein
MESLQQANRLTYSALALEQYRLEAMELAFLPLLVLHQLLLTYVLSSAQQPLSVHQVTTSQ